MCMCMYICICMYVCAWTCKYVCKGQSWMLVSSLIAVLHLIFWAGSLTELAAPGFHESGWPMSSRDSTFLYFTNVEIQLCSSWGLRIHTQATILAWWAFISVISSVSLSCVLEDRVSFGHPDWPQPHSPQLLEYRYRKPLPLALITTFDSPHCGSLF